MLKTQRFGAILVSGSVLDNYTFSIDRVFLEVVSFYTTRSFFSMSNQSVHMARGLGEISMKISENRRWHGLVPLQLYRKASFHHGRNATSDAEIFAYNVKKRGIFTPWWNTAKGVSLPADIISKTPLKMSSMNDTKICTNDKFSKVASLEIIFS